MVKVYAEDTDIHSEKASRAKPALNMLASSEQLQQVDHAIKHPESGKANEAIKRRASFAARNAGGSISGPGGDGKGIPNSMNITSVVDYANRVRKVSAWRGRAGGRAPRQRGIAHCHCCSRGAADHFRSVSLTHPAPPLYQRRSRDLRFARGPVPLTGAAGRGRECQVLRQVRV